MPKITDHAFAIQIGEALTAIQNRAIELKLSGVTEHQSVVPSVDITYGELRTVTGRQKIKTAFLNNLQALLEDEGLEVMQDDDLELITVIKPPRDLEVDFESFKQLKAMVKVLQDQ